MMPEVQGEDGELTFKFEVPRVREGDGCRLARVVQVIQAVATRGKGEPDDPFREVTQYWSANGKLLAEMDAIEATRDIQERVKEEKPG